jgi:hypothetical protein
MDKKLLRGSGGPSKCTARGVVTGMLERVSLIDMEIIILVIQSEVHPTGQESPEGE